MEHQLIHMVKEPAEEQLGISEEVAWEIVLPVDQDITTVIPVYPVGQNPSGILSVYLEGQGYEIAGMNIHERLLVQRDDTKTALEYYKIKLLSQTGKFETSGDATAAETQRAWKLKGWNRNESVPFSSKDHGMIIMARTEAEAREILLAYNELQRASSDAQNLLADLDADVEFTPVTLLLPPSRKAGNIVANLTALGLDSFDDFSTYPVTPVKEWDESFLSIHGIELHYGARRFNADAEDVAEGGFEDVLRSFEHVLHREGVPDIDIRFDNEHAETEQAFFINGERYVISKPEWEENQSDWHLATVSFQKAVNDLLRNAGSRERMYVLAGGNDQEVVFLTPELERYIRSLGYRINEYTPTRYDGKD